MIYEDLYCKLFIDTDMEYSRVSNFLYEFLGGNLDWHSIYTNCCEVYVRKNDDFHKEYRYTKGFDSFLYFRYFLDIEPIEGCSEEIYIQKIGELLLYLSSKGFRAVAACDFEHELPQKGIFM